MSAASATCELFVSASWLSARLQDEEITVIDARMLPPGETTRDILAEYRAGHLPGAVFFDIETLSDGDSPLPHMMPDARRFARDMAALGIGDDRHLVVYDEGNLFSAPRAWWMLRTFGAARVSILAGGLAEWSRRALPLEQGDVRPPAGRTFRAQLKADAIVQSNQVLAMIDDGSAQIVDARPAPRFNCEVDEPRPGLQRGRIPGSVNVPWNALVSAGALKPEAELSAILRQSGVDLSRPLVASCGSGVTAAVVVLALTALDIGPVRLYDGSWSEWGGRDDLPIAKP